jgi:hypothetical protein
MGPARLVRPCAGTSVLVGTAGLLGWLLDVELLKTFAPGLATMKPNTALGFVLAGAAVWRCRHAPRDSTALILGAAVGALGGLTLLQYASGWDLRIDQALFRDPLPPAPGGAPGRMSEAIGA